MGGGRVQSVVGGFRSGTCRSLRIGDGIPIDSLMGSSVDCRSRLVCMMIRWGLLPMGSALIDVIENRYNEMKV